MSNQASNGISVSVDGILNILVTQVEQNWGDNTSEVQVVGAITNTGTGRVSHLTSDITASISGTASFTGGDFSFDLDENESDNFIQHTFVVTHNTDGTKSVSFTVNYGTTGTATFGSNKSVSVSLTLTTIPTRPDPPGAPGFANETPTSITVSWAASDTEAGDPTFEGYLLRWYEGVTPSGNHVDNFANNRSRNLTNLTPGQIYTFEVYARNGSVADGGLSVASDPSTIQMLAGCWVRTGGVWKIAVPYVRSGGVWKLAIPYVRSGGTWKLTN